MIRVGRIGTLRGRLALVVVLTTSAWAGLLTVGFNVVLAGQLHNQATSLLRERAAVAAGTVEIGPDGQLTIHDPATDEALDSSIWIYAGKDAVERPRAGQQLDDEADRLADSGQRFALITDPAPTRLFALPIKVAHRQVATVVSAVSLDPYRHVQRVALLASLGLAVLLLAGVYGATRILVGRALAPMTAMSRQAARWSAEDETQRFGQTHRPRELAALASNLDGLLDRLDAVLRHEQHFTEELSHELRTPLALITAETDLLTVRSRTPTERALAYGRISDASARMSRILETLLTAARSRGLPSTGRCELRPVAELAAARCAAGDVTVTVVGPPGLAAGAGADVVERILAPLLDNAVRYATRSVQVELAVNRAQVVLRVTDDGPGVEAAVRDAVFEPGRRGSDDGHLGAGLGLALARRLARAAGGDLQLTSGGAFEIRLPRVA
jgi:signal transduction histidine kinase